MGGKLSLKNVSKSWNGFKLKNINLEIHNGEYFVLVGPTGSGKTLLLETIKGFYQLDEGNIFLDGDKVTELSPDKRNIGYVPQLPSLSSELTIRENIDYILKKRGLAEEQKMMIDGIIKMIGLKDVEDRKAVNLSGGEKRKVALARALVLEPKTLLLDEPFNNLDITMKQNLRDELKLIHKFLNLTVIHVTHNQNEALHLAHRLGVLRDGEIVKVGTIEEVFVDPYDVYAARFLGYENIFPSKVLDKNQNYTKMKIQNTTLRAVSSPKATNGFVGIHGDEINLTKKTPSNVNDNIFRGTIIEYTNIGPLLSIIVDIGIPLKLHLSKRSFLEMGITKNEAVWVTFKKQAVKHLI